MKNIAIKLLVFLVIVAAATLIVYKIFSGPKTRFYNINVDGHIYTFSKNPKESKKVYCSNPELIQIKTYQAKKLMFVFNGSNEKDNALFSVMGENIVLRLKPYFEYQGIKKEYNASEINSFVPEEDELVIKFLGPHTGANGTYVMLENNTIIISGNTTKGAQMAADRYVLAVFGI